MDMPNFTPGPWSIGFKDQSGCIDENSGAYIVARAADEVVVRGGSDEGIPVGVKQQANAHLIAASPDLYAALKAILAQFDEGYFVRSITDDHKPDWAIRAARSVQSLGAGMKALEKAEGKS